MVDYNDQRPTRPVDTLKEILTGLRVPASTPHGIKIAKPTEYAVYYDRTGTPRTWSGDTIADINKDMTALKTSLQELDKKLEEGGGRIQDGGKIVGDVKTKLDQLEKDIQAAQASATTATQTAKDAKAAAEDPNLLARSLNGSKALNGTALSNNSVGAGQLRITSELAAGVVNAMDVNAKRLVVTDDAILQRATVIGGIVTSELTANTAFTEKLVSRHIDAEKIVTEDLVARRLKVSELAAQMITSGHLQTDSADNRGVKLNSAGITAFDDSGKQTVKINANGEGNYFTGTLATSSNDEPGVTIYTDIARGPAGSRSSIIEMRPQEASMQAPKGIIRMDPQGWFTFGMKHHDDPQNVYRGLSVDWNGGVNISESLRVKANVRVEGFFSQTKTFFHVPLGPYTLNGGGWQEIRVGWGDVGQLPYVVTQVISGNPIVATINNLRNDGCSVWLNHLGRNREENFWVELYVLPLNRSKGNDTV